MAEAIVSTYSIVAADHEAEQWGVAVQSKFLSVGSVVPWAEPHIGAIATQAYANPRYGPNGLQLLREGLSAQEAVDRLTGEDEGREHRQLGIVDGKGNAATYTGKECMDWAGGRTGAGYAAQGNILVSGATVDALAETFEGSAGQPLAERLIECLAAAQAAGGDSRGQQSSALLVVERDGGYARMSDVVVELRVEDHERPIEELRRIYALHDEIFGKTPRRLWLDVDEALASELRERLAKLGYEGELAETFVQWTGKENLEDHVDGIEQIDPVVLEAFEEPHVNENAYEVTHIDDLDRFPIDNDELLWRPVRRKLGITAFGTNAYTAEKGHERVVEEHYEREGAEELYFVASGRATFTLGDEEIDAPAGTFVYAEPGTKRGALAAEPKTTVVAFGARRGVPHEISGWEEMFVAFGHLHNGNEDEGRKTMAAAIAAKPDAWQGHFNAACFESLTGNREATFEHLRRAIELDPTAAEYAQKDTDFDWLRDDPEFPA